MKYLPTLTIAGSDSSGGAGIQADIKTMSALGCYAMSVVTSITAQNSCGVRSVFPLPADLVGAQIEAILEDIPPLAIKVGMLPNKEIIRRVATLLSPLDTPLIIDPVMVATSGDHLIDDSAVCELSRLLLPIATLITPNLYEAEVLSGVSIRDKASLEEAAANIRSKGASAVLIKGGHTWEEEATDYLFSSEGCRTFTQPRIESQNTHGTGCTLSSAIASYIAQGNSLPKAVGKAKEYLTAALLSGKEMQIGQGHGPVDHFYNPQESIKQ